MTTVSLETQRGRNEILSVFLFNNCTHSNTGYTQIMDLQLRQGVWLLKGMTGRDNLTTVLLYSYIICLLEIKYCFFNYLKELNAGHC